eukprot:1160548-Pelagomonas_calceolata.AAC.2
MTAKQGPFHLLMGNLVPTLYAVHWRAHEHEWSVPCAVHWRAHEHEWSTLCAVHWRAHEHEWSVLCAVH